MNFNSGKAAIIVSSIVSGLFSLYLVVSFVHLKIKASVSNMRCDITLKFLVLHFLFDFRPFVMDVLEL